MTFSGLYDTVQYNEIFMCAQKLTNSQINLVH